MGHTKRKTAWYGVLTALGMILGYVESLIPVFAGVPGVKPGLANLVSFFALLRMTARDALILSAVRVTLTGFTFGNLSSMAYSMAGALFSLFIMWLCKKRAWFGPVGISMAGGISHNLGQLFFAACVLENAAVFSIFRRCFCLARRRARWWGSSARRLPGGCRMEVCPDKRFVLKERILLRTKGEFC